MNASCLRGAGLVALLFISMSLCACPGTESGLEVDASTTDIGWHVEADAASDSGWQVEMDAGPDAGGETEDAGIAAPDAETDVPPLSRIERTPFSKAMGFLLDRQGISADAGVIEPGRMAVLHGRVLKRGGRPAVGVHIYAPLHPELGSVATGNDGEYDFAVNGGGEVSLAYSLPGYLEIQRMTPVPWNDFTRIRDVNLTPLGASATLIDFGSNLTEMTLLQGDPVSDSSGERTTSVLMPKDTRATMVLPDGSTRPLTSGIFRATEYTVGPEGPSAMPGELPATVAYTYAVELSFDEAHEAGATSVEFDQPIPVYVDNYLNLPVGTMVPTGYFDRTRGIWLPADNGRIIGVLETVSGLAELDLDGSGIEASEEALEAEGITQEERVQVAATWQPGMTFSRVMVSHFTL